MRASLSIEFVRTIPDEANEVGVVDNGALNDAAGDAGDAGDAGVGCADDAWLSGEGEGQSEKPMPADGWMIQSQERNLLNQWIQCDICQKWRRLPALLSTATVPEVGWINSTQTPPAPQDPSPLIPPRPPQYHNPRATHPHQDPSHCRHPLRTSPPALPPPPPDPGRTTTTSPGYPTPTCSCIPPPHPQCGRVSPLYKVMSTSPCQVWTCDLHPDPKYNTCHAAEEVFNPLEEDVVGAERIIARFGVDYMNSGQADQDALRARRTLEKFGVDWKQKLTTKRLKALEPLRCRIKPRGHAGREDAGLYRSEPKGRKGTSREPVSGLANSSGYVGVSFSGRQRRNRWRAEMLHRSVGTYEDKYEAGVAVTRFLIDVAQLPVPIMGAVAVERQESGGGVAGGAVAGRRLSGGGNKTGETAAGRVPAGRAVAGGSLVPGGMAGGEGGGGGGKEVGSSSGAVEGGSATSRLVVPQSVSGGGHQTPSAECGQQQRMQPVVRLHLNIARSTGSDGSGVGGNSATVHGQIRRCRRSVVLQPHVRVRCFSVTGLEGEGHVKVQLRCLSHVSLCVAAAAPSSAPSRFSKATATNSLQSSLQTASWQRKRSSGLETTGASAGEEGDQLTQLQKRRRASTPQVTNPACQYARD